MPFCTLANFGFFNIKGILVNEVILIPFTESFSKQTANCQFLRAEQRFSHQEELKAQIQKDIDRALSIVSASSQFE